VVKIADGVARLTRRPSVVIRQGHVIGELFVMRLSEKQILV
jgi:hypothetical protein